MGTIGEEIQQKKFISEYHKMVMNIVYTGNWITALNSSHLRKHNLSPPQFNILRILRGQHPKPATVNLLIERMLDKMSNASRLVDRLKEKGWVERSTNENDRRACDVLISKKGLSLLKKIDEEQEEWEESFSGITKAEAKELNRLLDKLRG
ncbi:MAG: MarR family transcriptional regulator [Bacteroidia bacterium]